MLRANELASAGIEPATIGAGSEKRKYAPSFGRSEPWMRPPCALMIDWQMARPTPIAASSMLKRAFENMLHVAVGDAKAIVKNRKDDRPVFIEPSPDVDQVRWLSRLCDRLDAVDQQVDYHLLQLNPFACHAGNRGAISVDTVIHFENIASGSEAQYVVSPSSPNL
jgi:hypothetical protein